MGKLGHISFILIILVLVAHCLDFLVIFHQFGLHALTLMHKVIFWFHVSFNFCQHRWELLSRYIICGFCQNIATYCHCQIHLLSGHGLSCMVSQSTACMSPSESLEIYILSIPHCTTSNHQTTIVVLLTMATINRATVLSSSAFTGKKPKILSSMPLWLLNFLTIVLHIMLPSTYLLVLVDSPHHQPSFGHGRSRYRQPPPWIVTVSPPPSIVTDINAGGTAVRLMWYYFWYYYNFYLIILFDWLHM